MNQYIFIFGSNPALSFAEIEAVLQGFQYQYTVEEVWSWGVQIKTDQEIRPGFMDVFGGVVKIAQVLPARFSTQDLVPYMGAHEAGGHPHLHPDGAGRTGLIGLYDRFRPPLYFPQWVPPGR